MTAASNEEVAVIQADARALKRMQKARTASYGMTVDLPGFGPVIITRWSGHADPYPIGRMLRDPKYFGSVVFPTEEARAAALAVGGYNG